MKKRYEKPTVMVENFTLDAEFASGACASITVTDSQLGQADGVVKNFYEAYEIYQTDVSFGLSMMDGIADTIGSTADAILAAYNLYGDSDEFSAWVSDRIMNRDWNGTTDNGNSGNCYFTIGAVVSGGKSFS